MKNYIYYLVFGGLFLAACSNNTTDNGVVINGVTWATRNVNSAGTFADSPEDAGMMYQWNRKTGWKSEGSVSGWDSSLPTGSTWERENDPSPAGWRVPTLAELKTLLDTANVKHEWAVQNGVGGRKFTDKHTGNSLFLPAAGYRKFGNGDLFIAGAIGNYWGSTQQNEIYAYMIYLISSDAVWHNHSRRSALSIRPVAE